MHNIPGSLSFDSKIHSDAEDRQKSPADERESNLYEFAYLST
jgi:hypothetical protein